MPQTQGFYFVTEQVRINIEICLCFASLQNKCLHKGMILNSDLRSTNFKNGKRKGKNPNHRASISRLLLQSSSPLGTLETCIRIIPPERGRLRLSFKTTLPIGQEFPMRIFVISTFLVAMCYITSLYHNKRKTSGKKEKNPSPSGRKPEMYWKFHC